MDQIKVYYDETGRTLTVWFGDPAEESVAEEIGDEIIVMKSGSGKVLGFEKLNVHYPHPSQLSVAFEHAR
ncbi:MAG: DUF2283 domain-containing protein [Bacteroidota bacterium]|nr:DUF2283 domain-containing protein [Bacteroidota bacterium]MDP4232292.1 DUF2283 domain-containing protein [Bacteroidota bacterium]MDP4241431.1 DUF2283 domain-containing protein [Bacteroidota bacterium]MDP4286745.1 DUF2283 domain-containing protein [Bacteroidota bacterium]